MIVKDNNMKDMIEKEKGSFYDISQQISHEDIIQKNETSYQKKIKPSTNIINSLSTGDYNMTESWMRVLCTSLRNNYEKIPNDTKDFQDIILNCNKTIYVIYYDK